MNTTPHIPNILHLWEYQRRQREREAQKVYVSFFKFPTIIIKTTPNPQEPTRYSYELLLEIKDKYPIQKDAEFVIYEDYKEAVDRLEQQQKVIDELEEEIKKPQSWSGEILSKQVVKQMYDRDIRLLGIISKLKGAQDD